MQLKTKARQQRELAVCALEDCSQFGRFATSSSVAGCPEFLWEILNSQFPLLFFEKSLSSIGMLAITSFYWTTLGKRDV